MVVSMKRWEGKVAIVTGASAGIGAAVVKGFVNAGLQVVGLARRTDKMDKLSQTLEGRDASKRFFPIQADMTKKEDILRAFEWVQNNLGPPHIVINNAGVAFRETLMERKTETWQKVLNTNVVGLSVATREAVKQMRENGINGHIIHINSITGHQAIPIPNLSIIISNKSLPLLFGYLKNRFDAKYLLTYRLNQDVLESFFGVVRSKGGLHDAPDPLEFKYRLRAYILGRNEGSYSNAGNVEDSTPDLPNVETPANTLSVTWISPKLTCQETDAICSNNDDQSELENLHYDGLEYVAGN